jgi:hypothetical protein
VKLVVRYSAAYGNWMWEVTHGYGKRWIGWRPTYPEAMELGVEDLLAQDASARRNGVKVINPAGEESNPQ